MTTKIDGIANFEGAWERRSRGEFFDVRVAYLSLHDMLRTKRAARRPKDLGDIDWLEDEIARRRASDAVRPKRSKHPRRAAIRGRIED